MNTKNNQRYQETEGRLIEAFIELLQTKNVEQITVRELCRMCGINRSSYYLHFADVYDMMETIEQRLADYYFRLFTTSDEKEGYDIGRCFRQLFAFVREHQNFYRAYFSRNPAARVLDAAQPEDMARRLTQAAEDMGYESDDELGYHRDFFNAGLTAMLRRWLDRDCRESPEEIAAILGREYRMRWPSAPEKDSASL